MLKLILFTIILLFGAGIFMYLNKCRTAKIETFVEEVLEHDPTQCDYYIQEYETNSNSEFRDAYLRCTEHISTVETELGSLLNSADLIDAHDMLTETKSNLLASNQELDSNLTDSNNYYASLSNSNVQLTAQHAGLTASNSNLETISNLLNVMDNYQLRIDSLSNLEAEITNQVCTEMSGGCRSGLQSIETLTTDKLQEVLQNHINIVPKLSKAYILAVKMWIAYKKASGTGDNDALINPLSDSNMLSALNAYNNTISLFNTVETSMYSVVQYFSLYKENFYYTTHAAAESNSTITLSNIPNIVTAGNGITIGFNSNDSHYTYNAGDDVYDKLFETCTSSNTQSLVGGPSNQEQYTYSVEASCASSNYAEIIESISNCDDRDTCVKEQSSNVQSGLEYIYRSKFSREDVNGTYTDDDDAETSFSSATAEVDEKIVKTFLHHVFNTNKPSTTASQ
jgi:hypothetical protein